MIEAYNKVTTVPVFTEAFGIEGDINPAATTVMLSQLETAHARRLDILITQSATGAGNGIQSVSVRAYTAGRKFYHEYQVHAAFTSATHAVQVGEAYNAATMIHVLGDTIDIVLTNGTQTNTVQVWAIART